MAGYALVCRCRMRAVAAVRASVLQLYESTTLRSIVPVIQHALTTLAEESPAKAMDLVLFDDAVRHTLRISRIIGMPKGNALLVGTARGQQLQSAQWLPCPALMYSCDTACAGLSRCWRLWKAVADQVGGVHRRLRRVSAPNRAGVHQSRVLRGFARAAATDRPSRTSHRVTAGRQ